MQSNFNLVVNTRNYHTSQTYTSGQLLKLSNPIEKYLNNFPITDDLNIDNLNFKLAIDNLLYFSEI